MPSGLDFARFTISLIFLTGTEGLATRIIVASLSLGIGAKSVTGLKGALSMLGATTIPPSKPISSV